MHHIHHLHHLDHIIIIVVVVVIIIYIIYINFTHIHHLCPLHLHHIHHLQQLFLRALNLQMQNFYNVICTGVFTEEFLHRSSYIEVVAQELLHRSCCTEVFKEFFYRSCHTGVNFSVIYLYLNPYNDPTSSSSTFSFKAAGAAKNRFAKRDPLRRSCVSDAQTCGQMRIRSCWSEPSAEIARVFARHERKSLSGSHGFTNQT